MAGTAQAAELIHCDRCSGHYVVDASGDGKPRVRCNKCGHLRETAAADVSPASIPGKWTVIGPDGKAMSFDTWEELTESRRPSAITTTAKAHDDTKDIPKDRRSASALLDITPEPHKVPEKAKLALADMDSEIDLGGGRPKRTSTLTSTLTPGSAKPGGRMEPLAIPSFSQAPKSAGGTPKLEWAPKIEKAPTKSDTVPRPASDIDNTLRVEVAPPTARVIEADRPTAPSVTSEAEESIDELDADSLIEDADDYADAADESDAAPLSLRDAMADSSGDVLGDDDLQDDDAPDPHEHLSLRDLVVVPAVAPKDAGAKESSPAPPQVVTAPMPGVAPRASVPPPRPKSLSRPDLPRAPLPSLSEEVEGASERTSPSSRAVADMKRRAAARAAAGTEPKSKRGLVLGGIALLVVAGVVYRLATPGTPPPPPPPAPKPPVVATTVPPTPVTTPAPTQITPPPPDTSAIDVPTETSHTPPEKPVVTTTQPTGDKPVVTTTTQPTGDKPAATPPKPTVANTDSPGSMSDLLDKAGSARRKGDYATARDLYQRVIAMAPTNVEANGGLGDVARAQGDLAGAKASYERALAASPTYTPAQLGLADVEWDQGNKPSAIKRYSAVVDRMGDRAPQRAKERAAH